MRLRKVTAEARSVLFLQISCPGAGRRRRFILMSTIMAEHSDTDALLRLAAAGDQRSWETLVLRHRARLRRMVSLRLDHRLQGRLDASDVLGEAFLEAWSRLGQYLHSPTMPFFLWLRLLTGQRLMILHRRHLRAEKRDASREISLYRGALPETSSAALAARLLGREARPSEVAIRAEMKVRLQEALNRMDAVDREVLALRHFEQLTNAETAQTLGIQESAASKRYLRALKRLRDILTTGSGGPHGTDL
jgi:RNA polymerase sigma-70 factor (ECF subfamily)